MGTHKNNSNRKSSNFRIFKYYTFILFSIFIFGLGYYILNYISIMETPFLGNTFHIILGCILMATSLIFLGFNINKILLHKKRKKHHHHNHVFLKDQKNRQNPD